MTDPRQSDVRPGLWEWWRAAPLPLPSAPHPFVAPATFARLTGGTLELDRVRVYRTREEAVRDLERAQAGAKA
jgi:hypothetical protein